MPQGSPSARPTVVLDPDLLAAKMLRLVLSEAGYSVLLVNSPAMAIAHVGTHEVQAVLLETTLPGMSGYQLCKELRGRGYSGPLVFVSQQTDIVAKLRAFDSGADDYVVKPFDPQELIARVDSIRRRCSRADHQAMGNVLAVGDAELAVSDLTLTIRGRRPVVLTPTEMRLLECLMRNSGITISRDTLIDRAWPHDFIADTNRVDVYVARLRKKVERDPVNPDHIKTVRGVGYVFRPSAPDRVVMLHGPRPEATVAGAGADGGPLVP
jgi:two-component system, OmpR family, response regulator RegX3